MIRLRVCGFWLRFGYPINGPGTFLVTAFWLCFCWFCVRGVQKTHFLVTRSPFARNQFCWLRPLGKVCMRTHVAPAASRTMVATTCSGDGSRTSQRAQADETNAYYYH